MNIPVITLSSGNYILSQVVDFDKKYSLHEPLPLTLTIASHANVELIDDLHEISITKSKVECFIQEGATFNYYLRDVQENNKDSQSASKFSASLEREIIVRLVGKKSQATVTCICLGRGEKVFKFKTLQDHQQTDAKSSLCIKSVLDDKARLFCHNLIKIQPGAHRSDAEQENKNILLSHDARAVSVPMLEIEADDVRCKHGAAISRIDDEHIFYLESRGIDRKATRSMLIDAFLQR